MMLLPNEQGVACDYCNNVLQNRFVYYSFDIYKRWPKTEGVSSLDVCDGCFELWKNKVLENYKPPKNGIVFCDITGNSLRNEYYEIIVSKASVDMNSINYTCEHCGAVFNKGIKCSRCGSMSASKNVDPEVEEDLLRIEMCKEAYNELEQHKEEVRSYRHE